MRRLRRSSFVAFSLGERERARLSGLAQRLGYAHVDPLAADLFRIGLASLGERFVATTRR